jgi:D-alanyl-D-alanine carboxypeptidase/D-alanyl-D-alanine-endopeptidase (penicillin-binding protein 4)
VLNFLSDKKKSFYLQNLSWKENVMGFGWAWDDYNSNYMAERSAFPVYGNTVKINLTNYNYAFIKENWRRHINLSWKITPAYFKQNIDSYFILPPKIAAAVRDSTKEKILLQQFFIKRNWESNNFSLLYGNSKFVSDEIPFHTNDDSTAVNILKYDYAINIQRGARIKHTDPYPDPTFILHSQPTDSLFKPMMHRSDNFFAEQTLLMASNEHLGYMSDEKIIDTILKLDLKDIPQKPKWVDGSGLSRYNLFTPKDFVYILNKMQNEFGLQRMKVILPTGGEGTITSYFKKDAGFIYAKTGTLSNNCALSGYLITNKGKLLIFSILANNYITGATPVRRAEERFLEYIREKY